MTIDFTSGKSHYEIGKLIGEALHHGVAGYEKQIDSFISLTAKEYGYPEIVKGTPEEHYRLFIERVTALKPLIPQDIRDEIEGVADTFSGGSADIMNDGKLSKNEY